MKLCRVYVGAMLFFSGTSQAALAQGAEGLGNQAACVAELTAVNAVPSAYTSEMKSIENEGSSIKDDSKECDAWAEFECENKLQTLKFDTPSAKMVLREYKLDLPQVKMNTKELKFDVPTTRSVMKTVGGYLDMNCHGLKCNPKWRHIRTRVPEVYMRRESVKMDIPEFAMKRTSFKLDVPEFFMQRQEVKLDLPSCKLVGAGVNDDCKGVEERGKALESRSSKVADDMRRSSADATGKLFECYIQDLIAKRASADAQFSMAIDGLDRTIETVRAAGGSTLVDDGSGKQTDLESQKRDVQAKRIEAMRSFDNAIAKLQSDQVSAVETVLGAKQEPPANAEI